MAIENEQFETLDELIKKNNRHIEKYDKKMETTKTEQDMNI